MKRPRQAVILAGGRGERLESLTRDRPKPLVPVAGRPFLEYLVELLSSRGFERLLLLLGHQAEAIVSHCGDGSQWGLRIEYAVTPPPMQTTSRLMDAAALLEPAFLLAYCDNYLPFSFDKMWAAFLERRPAVQLAAYFNDDGYSRSNLEVTSTGTVLDYDANRRNPMANHVDVGFAIIDRDRLPVVSASAPLEHVLYPLLAASGELAAYSLRHRYYGVGSLARLGQAEQFFTAPPSVVLDRDGVLNTRPNRGEYVRRPEEFHWEPGALEALRLFRRAGYRVVVVTNQAGIARGHMSTEDLTAIHKRMRSETAAAGGHITAIYHCNHHWDDGCFCRKPSPGMLFQAQRDLALDLTKTMFVGDDDRDEEAANAADCPFVRVDGHVRLIDIARRMVGSS